MRKKFKIILTAAIMFTAVIPQTAAAEESGPEMQNGHEFPEETAWMEAAYPITEETETSLIHTADDDTNSYIYSENVILNYSEAAVVYGESLQLSAEIEPEDADNRNVIWSSQDESVASVDQTGMVTAIKPGKTVITASAEDDNSSADCLITVQFTDVTDQNRYFYEPVYWAAENEITCGYGGSGKFSPDVSCTREQIVSFLWRMAGQPQSSCSESYSDVKESDWYYKAVLWATEKGITVGLNDGTERFGVGMPCTREMCVTFLYRAAGCPETETDALFTDVKSGKYYFDAVSWASENNITTGLNDGTGRFGVGKNCTRAMIVSLLYRQATGNLDLILDSFQTVTDETGRSYLVYIKDGQILKESFRLDQTYYHVDPETGEILHTQQLFNDKIYLEGIDISSHNGELDLADEEYVNGFVIIRVAWGTNTDTLAVRNMDLCEQLHIPYGVYLYSYAVNDEQVESEADYILNLIEGRNIELGVWFDIENDSYKAARISNWPNTTVISRHCKLFCDKIAAAGYHAGIYTCESWYNAYVKGVNSYDKWIANWGINDGNWNKDLSSLCSIHQFTSNPIDRDVFYTDPNLMK